MVYEYKCEPCDTTIDIYKSVKVIDREEKCGHCGTVMKRQISRGQHLLNTSVQDSYFSHSLGEVVKGNIHERKLAKERGMIEVGNEKPKDHLKIPLHTYDV